jgi:hypothetical protein
MKTKGYTLVESQRLPNTNSVTDSMCYCVFVKSSDTDILPLPLQKPATATATAPVLEPTTLTTATETATETATTPVLEPTEKNIQLNIQNKFKFMSLHPVNALSNVMDVLNCISFRGSISKEKDIILTTENFDKISNYLSTYFQINSILFKENQIQSCDKDTYLVFYATVDESESNTNENTVEQEIKENFYIVLYKKKIFYNISELKSEIEEPKVNVIVPEIEEPKVNVIVPEIEEPKVNIIREKLLKTTKLTVVVLKELLKELNLKTTGNKSELETRLKEALN